MHINAASIFLFFCIGKDLFDDVCRSFYNQFMFLSMYSLLKLLQILALVTLDLSRHDCPTLVNLLNNMVYHDTCFVVF